MTRAWVAAVILIGCGGGGGKSGDAPAAAVLHGELGKPLEGLAIAAGGGVAVASDGTNLVRLDLHTGATTVTPAGGSMVMALSADGAHLAAVTRDDGLTIDGTAVALGDDARPIGLAFAADGSLAVAGEDSDAVKVIVVDGTRAVRGTAGAGGALESGVNHCRIATSAKGDLAFAACAYHGAAIRMRDAAELVQIDLGGVSGITDLAEPAPGTFAAVGIGGELSEGHLVVALPGGAHFEARIEDGERCALAPSARLVACTAGGDTEHHKPPGIELRTVADKLPVAHRIDLPAEAMQVAFAPDGATLVAALHDGRLATADVRAALAAAPALPAGGTPIPVDVAVETELAAKPATVLHTYVIDSKDTTDDDIYISHVSGMAATRDGKTLALYGLDGTTIVDAATAKKASSPVNTAYVGAAAWSADGKHLAILQHDDDQTTFGVITAGRFAQLEDRAEGRLTTAAIAWTRDGTQLVATEPGGGIAIRSATDAARVRQIKPGAGNFEGFALGGEDRVLAWTSAKFAVWNLATDGKHAMPAAQHLGPVGDAAWSPDGARFATVSSDGTAMIWSAATLAPEHVLHASYHERDAIAWSPDGAHLAIADRERGITIWRVADGKPVARIAVDRLRTNLFAWLPSGIVIGRNRDLAWLAVPKL